MSSIVAQTKYQDLFDKLNLPVLLLDAGSLKVLEFNNKAEQFFEDISNMNLETLVDEELKKSFHQYLRKVNRSYYSHSFNIQPIIKERRRYLQLDACQLELDETNKIIQLIIHDQTELMEAKKAVEELSITDAMTGMFNFRYFKQNLEKDMDRSRRHGENLSLILFDVDNFKHYNDKNGHPAGDKLLKELGSLIKTTVRNTDVACRYGGEEFVVLCPHTSSKEALILAERLRQAIEVHPFDFAENQPLGKVSVSIGISSLQEHDISSTEDMKEKTDKALYEAKRSGRNRSLIFDRTWETKAS